MSRLWNATTGAASMRWNVISICYASSMAKTPRTRFRIRPGEPVPDRTPEFRKLTTDGYWELWWRTGPETYLTALEHRVIDGLVSTSEAIHHKNHDKQDNRPENLQPMTFSDHAAHHHTTTDWGKAVSMYEGGATITEIAEVLGSWSGNVSRALRKRGVFPVPGERQRAKGIEEAVLSLHKEGLRPEAIGKRLGVSRYPVDGVLKRHGIKPYPPGRPPYKKSRTTEVGG